MSGILAIQDEGEGLKDVLSGKLAVLSILDLVLESWLFTGNAKDAENKQVAAMTMAACIVLSFNLR